MQQLLSFGLINTQEIKTLRVVKECVAVKIAAYSEWLSKKGDHESAGNNFLTQ